MGVIGRLPSCPGQHYCPIPPQPKAELLKHAPNSGWLTCLLAGESPLVPEPPPLRAPHTRAASCAGGSPSAEQGTAGGAGGGAGAARACLQGKRNLLHSSMHGWGCQTQVTVRCLQPHAALACLQAVRSPSECRVTGLGFSDILQWQTMRQGRLWLVWRQQPGAGHAMAAARGRERYGSILPAPAEKRQGSKD